MARDFFLNGETMVYVKGRADSPIGARQELGLAVDAIRVTPVFKHEDIKVDAWGQAPPEVQWMLAEVRISMTLIHFDRDILDTCLQESMAGATAIGTLRRAGARMGNNLPLFAAGGVNGNHYISLNLASPVGNKPWRFVSTYMPDQPIDFPLGTEKSAVVCSWRAIPYTQDPWGGVTAGVAGQGAEGALLWTHVLDT
jgi:hypothetical protein